VRWGGLQPESYEVTATGRILFWRGGSLWIGLAGEPTGTHAQHAVQIALRFPHDCLQVAKRRAVGRQEEKG
jgi:hypothetical protein